jgi:hypothetical protein
LFILFSFIFILRPTNVYAKQIKINYGKGVTSSQKKSLKTYLNKVPDYVTDDLIEDNITISVGAFNEVTFNPSKKSITIDKRCLDKVLIGIGFYVDYKSCYINFDNLQATRSSQWSGFSSCYSSEKTKFIKTFKSDIAGNINTKSLYFAYSFYEYILHKSKLKTNTPLTYDYINNLIKTRFKNLQSESKLDKKIDSYGLTIDNYNLLGYYEKRHLIDSLDLLPSKVITNFTQDGYKIIIYSDFKSYAGRFHGTSVANSDNNYIELFAYDVDSILHEMGHYVDWSINGYSSTMNYNSIINKKFNTYFNKYKSKLKEFNSYAATNSTECFATIYASYYMKNTDRARFKKYCPKLYNSVVDCIKQYGS